MSPLFQLARAVGLGFLAVACGAPQVTGTRVLLPSYLFGTLGYHAFDTRDLCDGRMSSLELVSTPNNVLVSFLSLGIYTPHEFRLQCKPASPAPANQQRR